MEIDMENKDCETCIYKQAYDLLAASIASNKAGFVAPESDPRFPNEPMLVSSFGKMSWFPQAVEHLQEEYRKAFTADNNIPPVPNFHRWVGDLLSSGGGGSKGLSYIKGFQRQDFLAAFNAFIDRPNKELTWSGTWISNARNKRREEETQEQHNAEIKDNKKAALDNYLAQQIAQKVGMEEKVDELNTKWDSMTTSEQLHIRNQCSTSMGIAKDDLNKEITKSWWRSEELKKRARQ